jgi:hypothetical protein
MIRVVCRVVLIKKKFFLNEVFNFSILQKCDSHEIENKIIVYLNNLAIQSRFRVY